MNEATIGETSDRHQGVPAALAQLDFALDRADKAETILRDALQPYLREEHPSLVPEETVPARLAPASEVARRIEESGDRLTALARRVEALMARFDG